MPGLQPEAGRQLAKKTGDKLCYLWLWKWDWRRAGWGQWTGCQFIRPLSSEGFALCDTISLVPHMFFFFLSVHETKHRPTYVLQCSLCNLFIMRALSLQRLVEELLGDSLLFYCCEAKFTSQTVACSTKHKSMVYLKVQYVRIWVLNILLSTECEEITLLTLLQTPLFIVLHQS